MPLFLMSWLIIHANIPAVQNNHNKRVYYEGNMIRKIALTGCAALLFSLTAGVFIVAEAEARAGGGRSFGSRGTRSYSRPASPSTAPSTQQARPVGPSTFGQPQPAGGGFLRSMAGGIMGGMLGGMLFRSLGLAGGGMDGAGGIGIFEILLLAGIGYLIFKFIKSRRQMAAQASGNSYYSSPQVGTYDQAPQNAQIASLDDRDRGLSHIRQMDAGFDEARFNDQTMDIFFKIQSAWMNRDLSPVNGFLSDDMRRTFQQDIDRLLSEKRVNRLENIAVRTVEIAEAWQEQGQDYVTAMIYANLLDYTTDDATGQVVSGSKTEPVKFEEFWTFTRPVGSGSWKLCGIDQK
jgi:predicted lipid-binding transport protein (Tim44 family)